MPTRQYKTGLPVWIALGTVYVVWGSTYFGIAVAIESMPPFLMAAIRFLIAGGLLLGWELLRSGQAALPTRRQVRDSAIVGALLLGVGNGFVAFGEQTVASGIAAILVAMMPLWLAVFGWIYFRDRLPHLAVLGIAIGLFGVALLVWPAGGGANAFDLLGIATLLIAPIGWAHGSLFSAHRARLPQRPFVASGVQMLAGAAVLAIEGIATGELGAFHPEAITLRSVLALAYLIVFGSMVAFTAYGWLLRHAPLSLIGTYAYVNPIVAVALGAVFLAEPISARTLLASGVIVAAVAMIVTARGRAARGSEAETPEETFPNDTGAAPVAAVPAAASGAAAPGRRPSEAGVSLRLDPRQGSSD